MVIRQLSVFLENRSGRLAELIALLSDSKINLRAISIAEASDYGVVRMIVDHTDNATAVLQANGHIFTVTPVAAAAIPDEVGGLNKLLALLEQGNFNIEYMYSVFGRTEGLAYMIFKVADPDALDAFLSKAGIHTIGKRELSV